MTISTKVSGTWKTVDSAHVKVSGTWKQADVYVNAGGTWKQVGLTFPLPDPIEGAHVNPGGTATVTITLNRAGDYLYRALSGNETGDWVSPKSATVGDAYEVRLSKTSGDNNTSGASLGTWLALSSNRSWVWSTTSALIFAGTLEIRRASDSVVVATADVSVSADGTI